MHKRAGGFPLTHVLGFLGSLFMTFAAGLVALRTSWSFQTIMWIIGGLAIVQAGLQLFMFMHVTEGEEKNTQVINIAYGVFVALVIIIGTIWIMSGLHKH